MTNTIEDISIRRDLTEQLNRTIEEKVRTIEKLNREIAYLESIRDQKDFIYYKKNDMDEFIKNGGVLYNTDENCEHDIESLWSGVRCRKCGGWFCL